MPTYCPHDPFKDARNQKGVLPTEFNGEAIPMILRHKDVRQAAKDWQTFSSDTPFRVPIPSEENLRNVRQLPIETDPPEHSDYRKIVEPIFRRPSQPEFVEKVENLVDELLMEAAGRESVEVVRDFALPLQSRALTYLLNVPETEADLWISWGIHVFRDGGDGEARGSRLDDYIQRKLDEAEKEPGEDLFSILTRADYRGRPLTRDEMAGFANLIFAGGRDTVINTVAWVVGYMAEHPQALEGLRANPKAILTASEEFVRVVSPLTHIGRTCPTDTDVHGEKVTSGDRVSLCWASANYDESVFDEPEEVRLDRRPNPHIGYGSGAHVCPGAAHARLIIRSLLAKLCDHAVSLSVLSAEPSCEKEADYQRQVGYKSLTVQVRLL